LMAHMFSLSSSFFNLNDAGLSFNQSLVGCLFKSRSVIYKTNSHTFRKIMRRI
jgi:hypothetical protein